MQLLGNANLGSFFWRMKYWWKYFSHIKCCKVFWSTWGGTPPTNCSNTQTSGLEENQINWSQENFLLNMYTRWRHTSYPQYIPSHWVWQQRGCMICSHFRVDNRLCSWQVYCFVVIREVIKKTGKKRSGWPLGGGGSPPSSLTASILWKFWPILSFIKWQNNPKYDNLSRIFHIFLTASREGGLTQAVSLTAFYEFFFTPSLIQSKIE